MRRSARQWPSEQRSAEQRPPAGADVAANGAAAVDADGPDVAHGDGPRAGQGELADRLEAHRTELTGYCYRMLGSAFEAEDAVQETMVRAWRSYDRFEGRASLRSWLYRIATNVCLDLLKGSSRRARPMDLASPSSVDTPIGTGLPEETWIGPVPDERVLASAGDPAETAVARESVRLAFVSALQRLAPRQRAVLILREVLSWSAAEVAELLDSSVAAVNSALQRARATLSASADPGAPPRPLDDAQQALLKRYVDAFERFDMDALTALLHEDCTLSMPPYALWLRGRRDVLKWLRGPGSGCAGSHLVPLAANGRPAFGQYRADGTPWAVQVIETADDGRIGALQSFLDTERLFPLFGLPMRYTGPPAGDRGGGAAHML